MPHICSLLQVPPETYHLLRQIRIVSPENNESCQEQRILANLSSYRVAGCVSTYLIYINSSQYFKFILYTIKVVV